MFPAPPVCHGIKLNLIVEVLRTKFIRPYPGILFYLYRDYSEIQMYLPVVRTNQYFRSEIKNLEIRKLVNIFRNAMYITQDNS